MSSGSENQEFSSSELYEAYLKGNGPTVYAILAPLSIGTTLLLGDNRLEIVSPLEGEVRIMQESLRLRREFGLVKVGDQEAIIPGWEFGVNPRLVNEKLSELGAEAQDSLFSHTHWVTDNPTFHPLPSLGDYWQWTLLREVYPNCETRIVYNSGDEIRTFRYLGLKSLINPE